MAGKKGRSGGPGRGQGRKASDGATGVVPLKVMVLPEQREKVQRNGGSAWVRKLIDDACTVQKHMV